MLYEHLGDDCKNNEDKTFGYVLQTLLKLAVQKSKTSKKEAFSILANAEIAVNYHLKFLLSSEYKIFRKAADEVAEHIELTGAE